MAHGRLSHRVASVACLLGVVLTGVLILAAVLATEPHADASVASRLLASNSPPVSSSPPANAADASRADAAARFATTIRRPDGPPTIELGQADPHGRSGSIACSTCHSVRQPNFANRRPEDLDEFHQQMPMAHGDLGCYSCHNADDADTLRLADSTAVQYSDVMRLCAQCHGPQARDYEHGAHGGMNGYWDLGRGPRTRNNCIDCHDPHVPKFPSMQPTFKPRDRFLSPSSETHHE